MAQIHKRFSDEQVRELFKRYVSKEVERGHLQMMLGISKSRFFKLLAAYRENPETFSIRYSRSSPNRIDSAIETNILKELTTDKQIILNKDIPLDSYNYSFVRKRLEKKYKQFVSVSTIIDRAKKHDFYIKGRKAKIHDREVLTHYIGELVQHDSSYHLWAPGSKEKWWMNTSLDDHSRFLLDANLTYHERVWPCS